ncbi:MAG: LytTR family DNA-binding domain-containing protein [Agathobacter sp.]|nr:LytTR family DNA-binding domain-containing protein [Agathobacter sp.]
MIKIAIVEDEVLYADQLQEYLKKYEEEYRETFEISVFQDGDQIVHHYKAEYDVILMDVEMRFMDGMSAAEEIRKMDTEVVIIFITNMPQYAVRGYEVDALDYVLKPITYFAFAQRLNRAIERIKKRTKRVISVNIKGSQIRMPIESVYYIESQGHTLIFHGVNGEVEAPGTMKEIQEKLRDEHFFRGNKGYLINLAHVDRVVEGCAVVAGEELVLSRGRRKEFMEALAGYWGEAVR